MTTTEYLEKLKDPRWQKKRLEIFQRDEWTCQKCFDQESTLVVHHRCYLLDVEPWDYPDYLLITLCESCHELEREQWAEYETLLINTLKDKFFADDIRRLASGFRDLEIILASEVTASIIAWILSSPELLSELSDRFFGELSDGLAKYRK